MGGEGVKRGEEEEEETNCSRSHVKKKGNPPPKRDPPLSSLCRFLKGRGRTEGIILKAALISPTFFHPDPSFSFVHSIVRFFSLTFVFPNTKDHRHQGPKNILFWFKYAACKSTLGFSLALMLWQCLRSNRI